MASLLFSKVSGTISAFSFSPWYIFLSHLFSYSSYCMRDIHFAIFATAVVDGSSADAQFSANNRSIKFTFDKLHGLHVLGICEF
jgi:hypothetical protein